jgi:hypothetical protein
MGSGLENEKQGGERMFSHLRKHFGIPGAIAVIALVFAMFGGAYAATRHHKKSAVIITKLSQIKSSVRSQLKGAAGPAGPQGPAGSNGKDGSNGQNGAPGTPGAPGAKGKSVVLVDEEPETCEKEEGFTYEVESSSVKNEVCRGPEGSPWTAGGTLPSGKTETGAWDLQAAIAPGRETAISYPIPLASAISFTNAKVNSLATGTGELTSASPTITGLTHTNNKPPWTVSTPITSSTPGCIPAGTEITAVTATEITMSQNASATCAAASLSSPARSECDDGNEIIPATAEHPEADPGLLCVFVATPSASAAAKITSLSILKAGGTAISLGSSTAGARLMAAATAEAFVGGTFAVTAP